MSKVYEAAESLKFLAFVPKSWKDMVPYLNSSAGLATAVKVKFFVLASDPNLITLGDMVTPVVVELKITIRESEGLAVR